MSLDFSYMYRNVVDVVGGLEGEWDVFVSAFNASERVNVVYSGVKARRKIWVVHGEYGLTDHQLPGGKLLEYSGRDEAEFCELLLDEMRVGDVRRLCIDITGFMRPHMMCLIMRLADFGLTEIDVLYSEPITYRLREGTPFSLGSLSVRQVRGLEGVSNFDQSKEDVTIIGAGFDDRQISEVAQYNDRANKIVLLGFPPLRADMYQQNILQVSKASDVLSAFGRRSRYYAPANDPFVTAEVLRQVVAEIGEVPNVFLSPLSTKAQALGFILYYLADCRDSHTSVIYPFSSHYESKTSLGVERTWRYTVQLR